MTDRMKVYKKALTMLKKMPIAKQNHVVLLAMIVAGIVVSKKA